MLSNFVVVVGVLLVVNELSAFSVPGYGSCSKWHSSCRMVSPTVSPSGSNFVRPRSRSTTTVSRDPATPALAKMVGVRNTKEINSLKTGMKLEGTVVSSTPYAAFIEAGVVRPAKGGTTASVHGMLHKSDVSAAELLSLRNQVPTGTNTKIPGPKPLLEKNTLVTVFVKDVYKQSGRFTVTTDANIKKEDVVNQHERTRTEGLERRQSRRLRRQLEEVAAGLGVTGCVKGITAEGILVTVTSLGPMEVTGLIRKQDLPEQFQLPEHLDEASQAELLRQDFIAGRRISCIVSQVSPHPRASSQYNLKLDFEKFDEPPPDFEVTDLFDSLSPQEQDALLLGRRRAVPESILGEEEDGWDEVEGKEDEGWDDEEEGDGGDYDAEMRELFEELVAGGERSRGVAIGASAAQGGRRVMPVEDLYAWDALQDLIADGRLAESDVAAAVRSVGPAGTASDGMLSFEQFEKVVECLQDKMEGLEERTVDGTVAQREKAVRSEAASRGRGADAAEAASSVDEDFGENPGDEEGAEEGGGQVGDEGIDFDEAVQQAFDRLKGPDDRVAVATIREWEDMKELVEVGAVEQVRLDALLEEVGGTDGQRAKGPKGAGAASLGQEQFRELLMRLDDIVGETVGYRNDPRDDLAAASFHKGAEEEDEINDEEGGDRDDDDQDDGDKEALCREIFNEMCNTKQRVPVPTLLEWEEIAELLADQTLTRKDLQSMLKEVGSGMKGELDFDQFSDLLAMIEEATGGDEGEDEAEESLVRPPSARDVSRSVDEREKQLRYDQKQQSLRGQSAAKQASRVAVEDEGEGALDDEDYNTFAAGEDAEEEELTEEELQEMSKLIFDELKPHGKNALPIEAFISWQGIADELQEGTLTKDELMRVLRRVDAKKTGQLTYEQFVQVMDELEELAATREQSDGEGDEAQTAGKGFGEEAPVHITGKRGKDKNRGSSTKGGNGAEEQIEELTAELYQELKGKAKLLTLERLEQWDELRDLIDSGAMKRSALDRALLQLGARASGTLTLAQFGALLDAIQEKVELSHLDMSLLEDDQEEEGPNEEDGTYARQASQALNSPPRQQVDPAGKKSRRGDTVERDRAPYGPTGGYATEDSANDDSAFIHDDDMDDDGDGEGVGEGQEMTEEEAALELYDELRGTKEEMLVADFLRWPELQDLLRAGAVTREQLAGAMNDCEIDVENGDRTELPFEKFFELIQVMDSVVDHSKLDHSEDGEVEAQVQAALSEQGDHSPARKKAQKSVETVAHGLDEHDEDDEDDEDGGDDGDYEDEDGDEEGGAASEQEIVEIFNELSRGKGYIPMKALREWDELQGLVEAQLVTEAELESYLSRLKVQGGKIDLPAFRAFIDMLDDVEVDEKGSIKGMDEDFGRPAR